MDIHQQSEKYNNMRQGDREYISSFKSRFDNQIKSNIGVGLAEVESRAIDSLGKMNGALQNNQSSSYPKTLTGAFRVASSWTTSGRPTISGEHHSAFLTDSAFVTKAKDPEKGLKTSSLPPDENKSKNRHWIRSGVICVEN